MEYEIWFCRHRGVLYAALSKPEEPPHTRPYRTVSVAHALRKLRENGHTVSQVGILDPEMIGLEESETDFTA